jgi:hypothetical protein
MNKQNELECSLVLPSNDTLNVIDMKMNFNDEIKKLLILVLFRINHL